MRVLAPLKIPCKIYLTNIICLLSCNAIIEIAQVTNNINMNSYLTFTGHICFLVELWSVLSCVAQHSINTI